MADDENERAFERAMDFIRNRPIYKFVEWWEVEDTGFTSEFWFVVTNGAGEALRHKSKEEAIQYIERSKASRKDPSVRWRYVHVTLEREDNKEVTSRTWTEV